MPAASTTRRSRRYSTSLVASLCLVAAIASAQPSVPLADRLAEIAELNQYVPERALPMLQALEQETQAAGGADRAEFLSQLCIAYRKLGNFDRANHSCDELIAFGRSQRDDVALAKGLLDKGDIAFIRGELPESHKLIWEGEKIAARSNNAELRIKALLTSGDAFAEEGNFPLALEHKQTAASIARSSGNQAMLARALNQLVELYIDLHEYDKGFAALEEAYDAAEQTQSVGRIALLKRSEYALARDSGQLKRAREALLASLTGLRKLGAKALIAGTLGNLADSYLKLKDYDNAALYAAKALEAGRALNNTWITAVAHINMGEAQIGKGRIGEGKRLAEEGLAMIEKAGDKPSLQMALLEYGQTLESAGDMAGAIKAYHRERDLSNELFEKRRQKQMFELQAKYDTDKKQQQIELLKRENQVKSAELDNRRLQQRVWWLLALVFALSSVIVGILYRKVRSANAKLEEKNLELKQQSVRDPLTGLYNRRHFQEYMRSYQPLEKRGVGTSGEELVGALFLLDVDQFKHINDSCGHAAGDSVLRAIADCLREILRETDMIVRWGGEEFLAFLPAIPRSGLDEVARRLLAGISSNNIEYQGKPLSANVSIGFAPFPLAPMGEPMSWERAVNLVDMALYLAKAHGRNRAYGVRGFSNFEQTSIEEVEQDLERAWRSEFVDLSIVLGGEWPELRAAG